MPDEIEGPLGIWPWPVLNTLIAISDKGSESNSLTVTEVHRDSEGRIVSIEEVEK